MNTVPPRRDRSSLTGPLAWMTQNSVAANLIMLLLLIGGGLMLFTNVKQEVFPEIDLERVLIQVAYPGASPAEVEQGVILAVEEAVRTLEDVKEVRSTANESVGVVVVELMLGANADRALADVKSAVDRVTSFPDDIERPVISLASFRRQVISLVLYGDKSEHEMRDLAERTRDELLALEDITYVELAGARPREISIEVPQEESRRYGLTLSQIASSIRLASVEVPGGGVKTGSGEVLLRTTERREQGAEFADVILASRPDGTEVRVSDVATVVDGFQETDEEAIFDGKRAVMVDVYRVGDETPIKVADAVKRYMEDNRDRFPEGVQLATWNDMSEMFRDRVDLLARNAALGLILVLLTLGLFLEMRLAFWVTLGIPISFTGSLILFPVLGISINMISLFAFIVTLGMVVDDAIIVGEAVFRRRREGMARLEAAISGVREVASPVTFSILTSCIAFSPLLFVPGGRGKFFMVIPLVVISVLLISLFESLFILPAHLAHSKPPSKRGLGAILHLQQQKFAEGVEWLIEKTFRPSLRAAVSWRYFTMGAGAMIFLATLGFWFGGRIDWTFMPKIESDTVTASVRMPFGTSVEETRKAHDRMQAEAMTLIEEYGGREEIGRGVFSRLGATSGGRSSMGGGGSGGSHLAEVRVALVPAGDRAFTAEQFADRWRERVGDVAGAEHLAFTFETHGGGGAAMDFRLSHSDMDVLEAAATQLAERLKDYEGVKEVDNGFSPGKEQLDMRLKPEARALGLTEVDLARQVRAAFYGVEAGRQQRGREELRIFVRRPRSERTSMHDLESFIARTPGGGEMPLSQAATLTRGRAYTSISRTDGRRMVDVTGDIVAGKGNAQKVVQSVVRDVIPGLLSDFPGLAHDFGGQQHSQEETMSSLGVGALMALLGMYALLAIAFRSYIQPAIVLGAIPFGVVGAVIGHVLMGYNLSLLSVMGMVALSGVVVNDSLILVVAINEFREDGMGLWEAVEAGSVRRFRPIILTSLTTFFGLVPMIAETSMQARFLIPMAISLGFGVLFATFITLLIVPASYGILEDIKSGAFRAKRFIWDSPEDSVAAE